MFNKFVSLALICALFACVQSAPQFDEQYQQPKLHEPEQQSRFVVADSKMHQDPNLEYNFE